MDTNEDIKPKGVLKRVLPLGLLLVVLAALLLNASLSRDGSSQVPLSSQHSTSKPDSDTKVGAMSLNNSVPRWHPPNSTWITHLDDVINGTGVHGFIFNGSQLPDGVPYGTYNWCNMPHVRTSEYPRVSSDEYQLEYVEVVSALIIL